MSLSKVCGAAVAAAAFAVFAGAAAADPAVVFNIGEGRLHSSCAGGVSGSQYEGFVATAVFNGDHMLLQCTARLVSGACLPGTSSSGRALCSPRSALSRLATPMTAANRMNSSIRVSKAR